MEREARIAQRFIAAWLDANGGAPMSSTDLVSLASSSGLIEPRGLTERGLAMSVGRAMRKVTTHTAYDAVQMGAHNPGRRWVLYPKEAA